MIRILPILVLFASSCIKPGRDFEKYKAPSAPEYSLEKNWAALPWVKDSADCLPKNSGLKDGQKDAKVDVFFIHPTSYFSRRSWNQPLDKRSVDHRTNTGSIMNQASVFNGSCAIYAPRYRQATLYTFVDTHKKAPSKNKNGEKALDLAYTDVKAAFEYFLSHYSKGRPFMIASHSQGTWHARRLLKELVASDTSLLKRMVAAYIIGGATPKNDFSVLVPCDSASQTGCFVCWNSMQWGKTDRYQKERIRECVNPISWKRDGKKTELTQSKGGSPYKLPGINREHVCAQCVEGELWVTKPRKGFYLKNVSNYHNADYNLFWLDIRENVDLRVKTYLAGKQN